MYIAFELNVDYMLVACMRAERMDSIWILDLNFICEKKLDFTQLTKSFKIEHVQQNTIDFGNRFSIGS